jgi:hypothetical protein
MSLRLQFASLSLGASVDQQTGSLSVFDVLEEVRTPQLPIQIQSLVISLSLEKTAAVGIDGRMLIHIITPDGKSALVGQGDMAIPQEQRRMKAVFRFGGFPLAQFGQHRFVLSWLDQAGKKQGEALLDFEVLQVTQVAQGVASGDKPPVAH